MKYITFPTANLNEIPQELLGEEETPQEPVYPYPTYEGEELNTLLSGPEWSSSESII